LLRGLGFPFVELVKWLWRLPSPEWGKANHKGKDFVLRGIGLEKNVSIRGVRETFVVARISPT
jgi:hypothetical protein